MQEEFFEELIKRILELKKPTETQVNTLKIELGKKFKVNRIVKNQEILSYCDDETREKLKGVLDIKPVRSISGVTVVALFAKPFPCPHGKCIYCPGGVGSSFGDTPQSYTGKEPAAMRAIRNDYDPYLQIFNRLENYCVNGHFPDKIEMIFMGGTFPSLPKEYKDEFVEFSYKAINDFGEEFVKDDGKVDYEKFNEFFLIKEALESENRKDEIHRRVLKLKGKGWRKDFREEIKRNETAKLRCVGLTIETKPDYAKLEHLKELLEFGATRLEIGVQTTNNSVLKKINRGHSLEDTKLAFRTAKDLCFKINAHMMIGLPFSDEKKDLRSLANLFSKSCFRPDMIKIYPCLLTFGTKLFSMFEKGKFVPISNEKAIEIISESFRFIPRYVRVMRIQRDIPTTVLEFGGITNSNLREFVDKRLEEKNIESLDIRSREVGFRVLKGFKIGKLRVKVTRYAASFGKEFFIEVCDENETLAGFLRLRFPSQEGLVLAIDSKTALVRELHVYGQTTAVDFEGLEGDEFVQHKGLGKKLIAKAEKIAKKNGFEKIAIISGVGVRKYYEKLGYSLEGTYMCKRI